MNKLTFSYNKDEGSWDAWVDSDNCFIATRAYGKSRSDDHWQLIFVHFVEGNGGNPLPIFKAKYLNDVKTVAQMLHLSTQMEDLSGVEVSWAVSDRWGSYSLYVTK